MAQHSHDHLEPVALTARFSQEEGRVICRAAFTVPSGAVPYLYQLLEDGEIPVDELLLWLLQAIRDTTIEKEHIVRRVDQEGGDTEAGVSP